MKRGNKGRKEIEKKKERKRGVTISDHLKPALIKYSAN
jgi:hypothetical protein